MVSSLDGDSTSEQDPNSDVLISKTKGESSSREVDRAMLTLESRTETKYGFARRLGDFYLNDQITFIKNSINTIFEVKEQPHRTMYAGLRGRRVLTDQLSLQLTQA